MRGRLTSEDFVHYGNLYMCPPGCEVFPFHIIKPNSTDLMSYEEPLMTLPAPF